MGKYRDHRSSRRGQEEDPFSSSDRPAEPSYFQHTQIKESPPLARADAREEESVGTVKWYKTDKGFGFISLPGLEKDVFVHASVFLAEGQKVTLTYAKGQKGLEARTVKPM